MVGRHLSHSFRIDTLCFFAILRLEARSPEPVASCSNIQSQRKRRRQRKAEPTVGDSRLTLSAKGKAVVRQNSEMEFGGGDGGGSIIYDVPIKADGRHIIKNCGLTYRLIED